MKGDEMIFLVNGFIFTGIATLAAAYARTITRTGVSCSRGNATLCARDLTVGTSVARMVPWLFAFGILLLLVAACLIWYRRRGKGETA